MALNQTKGPEISRPLDQPLNFESYQSPHRPQDRSTYYIGTIYERTLALEKKPDVDDDTKDSPYLQYVKRLAVRGWPQLLYLADFIECSTVPVKSRVLVPEDRAERLGRLHVAVLDFDGIEGTHHETFTTPHALSAFLDEPRPPDSNISARLIIVEDLSSALIEMLGSRFDIDPSFFRGQIGDYAWYNTRDPWVETPRLQSRIDSQSFTHFRYIEPRYFENKLSIENAKRQAGSFNVLRRIDFDSANSKWLDAKGSDIGMVRRSLSCWVRPESSSKTGWLCILLVDPPIGEGSSLWGGCDNFDPPPSIDRSRKFHRKTSRTSTMNDLIHWAESLCHNQQQVLNRDPEFMISPMYSFIASQWLLVFDYITTRLSQIEWELEHSPFRTFGSLDQTLSKFHPWRRRMPMIKGFIKASVGTLNHRHASSEANSKEHWSPVLKDTERLLERHEDLQKRVDSILAVLTAIMSIEENKKLMSNTQEVTRLTYLAFLFIPLSLVSGFLGMNEDFPSGGAAVYWIFFVISIPLAGIAMLMAYYWDNLKTFWRRNTAPKR